MQQVVVWRVRRGQVAAEGKHQTESVLARQILGGHGPFGNKRLRIVGGPQCVLQLTKDVVVKTEIGRRKLLFQNRRPGEQSKRSAFRGVGWKQQELPISVEESPGDVAAGVFGEGDGAIV